MSYGENFIAAARKAKETWQMSLQSASAKLQYPRLGMMTSRFRSKCCDLPAAAAYRCRSFFHRGDAPAYRAGTVFFTTRDGVKPVTSVINMSLDDNESSRRGRFLITSVRNECQKERIITRMPSMLKRVSVSAGPIRVVRPWIAYRYLTPMDKLKNRYFCVRR